MSNIEVAKLADVKVFGHKQEPETAVLRLTTQDGVHHHFDMTAPELLQMAMRLVQSARLLDVQAGSRQ